MSIQNGDGTAIAAWNKQATLPTGKGDGTREGSLVAMSKPADGGPSIREN